MQVSIICIKKHDTIIYIAITLYDAFVGWRYVNREKAPCTMSVSAHVSQGRSNICERLYVQSNQVIISEVG